MIKDGGIAGRGLLPFAFTLLMGHSLPALSFPVSLNYTMYNTSHHFHDSFLVVKSHSSVEG